MSESEYERERRMDLRHEELRGDLDLRDWDVLAEIDPIDAEAFCVCLDWIRSLPER